MTKRRPHPTFTVLAVAVGLFIPPNGVTAQVQTYRPEPGTRVRITAPCDATVVTARQASSGSCSLAGELVFARADTLALATDGSIVRYDTGVLRGFELSRGYRSYRLYGGIGGFLIGAGVTYLVVNAGGSTSLCDRSANQDAMNRAECLGVVALGGTVGAGIGVIVGGLFRSERWQPIPLQGLRLSLAPGRSARIVLRLSF